MHCVRVVASKLDRACRATSSRNTPRGRSRQGRPRYPGLESRSAVTSAPLAIQGQQSCRVPTKHHDQHVIRALDTKIPGKAHSTHSGDTQTLGNSCSFVSQRGRSRCSRGVLRTSHICTGFGFLIVTLFSVACGRHQPLWESPRPSCARAYRWCTRPNWRLPIGLATAFN